MKKILGQSMIEFAIMLPILILLVTGILEFSILFYDKGVISSASREGARYGITKGSSGYPTAAQVITYTKTFCNNNLITFSSTATSPTVTATPSQSSPVTGSSLTVTIGYTYKDLILHNLINESQTYNLSESATMIYQ